MFLLKIWQYLQKKQQPVLGSLFSEVALKFFIKKRPQHKYFTVNIAKFLGKVIFIKHR